MQSFISSKFEGNISGLHHRRQIYNPYAMSRLWRASFEFEIKPREMFGNELPGIYFPGGPNSVDTSIFHFGNNEHQVRTCYIKFSKIMTLRPNIRVQ